MITILIAAWLNSKSFDTLNRRLDDLRSDFGKRFDDVNRRFDDVSKRLDHIETKLDRRGERITRIDAETSPQKR